MSVKRHKGGGDVSTPTGFLSFPSMYCLLRVEMREELVEDPLRHCGAGIQAILVQGSIAEEHGAERIENGLDFFGRCVHRQVELEGFDAKDTESAAVIRRTHERIKARLEKAD